jgi:deoxyribodipyrimidine photolyase
MAAHSLCSRLYSRTWKALPQQVSSEPKPGKTQSHTQTGIRTHTGLPESPSFPAGKRKRISAWKKFLEQPVYEYANDRNRLDLDGTSTFPPTSVLE